MSTRQDRPLGVLEKYQTSKHLTRAYGNICLTGSLKHVVNEGAPIPFYMRYFQPALTRLIDTHAALSMVVRDTTESTIHFEQLTSIDLGKIVSIETQSMSLEELLKEQTTSEFDLAASVPLWRLKIIAESPSKCTVSLALNHIIGDGMSLCTIWNTLLQELNNDNEPDEEKSKIISVRHLKFPLPYELSNPPSISVVWDVLPVVLKNLAPKVLPFSIANLINPLSTEGWKGDFEAVEEEPHDTEVRTIHVPLDIWKPITEECKQRGISPHAVVFISMMLAWKQLYPGQTTEVSTPVNCRAWCDPAVPANVIGNYVGAYTSVWTPKQLEIKDIWKAAKRYHQDLQSNKMEASKQSLFLKYLPEYPASYCDYWYDKRKNSSMGRAGGLELSDLGKFKFEAQGDHATWKLNDLYFCQSAQTFTVALGLNSITVNDQLYCTLGWQKNALDFGKINMFHDIFIGILKDIPLKLK